MEIVDADIYHNMSSINSILEGNTDSNNLVDLKGMPYSYMKYLIRFNHNNSAKEFFNKSNIIDNIEFMKEAVRCGNLEMTRFLYHNRIRIPKDAIFVAISGNYSGMLEWLMEHNAYYTDTILDCALDMGHYAPVNLIKNLEIRKRIEKETESYNDILSDYIGSTNFSMDYTVLKDYWEELRYSIIVIGNIKRDTYEIAQALITPTLSEFHVKKLVNILTDGFTKTYDSFGLFDNLPCENHRAEIERIIKSYLILRIPSDNTLVDIPISSICTNIVACKKLRNKPLNYDSWKDVLLDDENDNIVYRTIDNYGYIITELLEWWSVGLSSYNYLIKPKYPSNPYNKSLFHPIEIYRIINMALIYKIKIPKPLLYIIKNPRLLFKMYLGSLCYEDDPKKKDSMMRKCLFSQNLRYIGGDAENNVEGYWTLDIDGLNDEYIAYMDLDLTNNVMHLIMCKIYNLISSKKVIFDEVIQEVSDMDVEEDTGYPTEDL